MSDRRSRSGLNSLQQGLVQVLGGETLERLSAMARIRRAWPDTVGPMMAERTEPVMLEQLGDGGLCLWIGVDHPAMAQQVRFLHEDIRKACLRQTHLGRLRRIRTRLMPQAGIKSRRMPARRHPVSWKERRAIARMLAPIRDKTLRRAMFEARIAQLAYTQTSKEIP